MNFLIMIALMDLNIQGKPYVRREIVGYTRSTDDAMAIANNYPDVEIWRNGPKEFKASLVYSKGMTKGAEANL